MLTRPPLLRGKASQYPVGKAHTPARLAGQLVNPVSQPSLMHSEQRGALPFSHAGT